jgi:hypothetical protein
MRNSTTLKGRCPQEMTGNAPNSPAMSQLEEQTVEGARKYAPSRVGVFLRAFSGGQEGGGNCEMHRVLLRLLAATAQ